MADYVLSLKRPFTDIKKLIIGIIVSLIPIVNILFAGYLIKSAKSAMRNNMELPEWSGIGDLFVKGILAIVINFIYMIPVGIVGLIALGAGLVTLPGLTEMNPLGIAGWIVGSGVVVIVVLIIAVIFALLAAAAILRFAEKDKFGAALDFGEVVRKAMSGTFIGGWLLTMIIAIVIAFLLGFIPFVNLISGYVVGIFSYTALAQIYSEE